MPIKTRPSRALSKPKHITKREHKHYWPYIPVLLLLIATVVVSLWQPAKHTGVLAYATQISSDSLLVATNQQREKNKIPDLQLDNQLSAAAQAKANDMVTRNYWAHVTPDGQQPWVFITQAGYQYQKAGENLAYGFTTSKDAVTGWMNSPSHRENLLDSGYTQVGFGFANSNDYNHAGAETVVVAMYGRPKVLGAAAPSQAPVSAQQQVVNSDKPVVAGSTTQITKIQSLTGGGAPWATFAVGLLMGLALATLLIKHAAGLRHIIRNGEQFALHHPMLDTVLVSMVFVGTLLSQTTGFIR